MVDRLCPELLCAFLLGESKHTLITVHGEFGKISALDVDDAYFSGSPVQSQCTVLTVGSFGNVVRTWTFG